MICTNLRPHNPRLQSRRQSPHHPHRPQSPFGLFIVPDNTLPDMDDIPAVVVVGLDGSITTRSGSHNDTVVSAPNSAAEHDLVVNVGVADINEEARGVESLDVKICQGDGQLLLLGVCQGGYVFDVVQRHVAGMAEDPGSACLLAREIIMQQFVP
jgi:hypothetical protein